MKFKYLTVILAFTALMAQADCTVDYAQYTEPVDGTYTSPNGAGTLIVEDGVRVLKLAGTNYEMGYAHGYLLAEEIIYTMDNLVLYAVKETGMDYDQLAADMVYLDWENSYEDELQGMLAGIRDKLSEDQRIIHPDRKGKEIELADLKISNTIPDWLCSSFSVWGQARADSTTLYARNLDYLTGRDEAFKRSHVIISYDDGQGRRWVNVSVCGFTACATGINEAGCTGALHDTDYYPATDDGDYIPRGFALRRVLETADQAWTPADVDTMLDEMPNYQGTNIHVTFPARGRADDDLAGVAEYDGYPEHPDGRATMRSPSDNPSLSDDGTYDHHLDYTYALINTNHYLKRRDDAPSASGMGDSGDRYLTIKDRLEIARSDGNVTVEEARQIMAAVGHNGTVHTVVFEPDSLKLYLFLAQPGLGGFDSPRLDYDFEDLF